jgi:hypothetical protein
MAVTKGLWRELGEQAAIERDSGKLVKLCDEINSILQNASEQASLSEKRTAANRRPPQARQGYFGFVKIGRLAIRSSCALGCFFFGFLVSRFFASLFPMAQEYNTFCTPPPLTSSRPWA